MKRVHRRRESVERARERLTSTSLLHQHRIHRTVVHASSPGDPRQRLAAQRLPQAGRSCRTRSVLAVVHSLSGDSATSPLGRDENLLSGDSAATATGSFAPADPITFIRSLVPLPNAVNAARGYNKTLAAPGLALQAGHQQTSDGARAATLSHVFFLTAIATDVGFDETNLQVINLQASSHSEDPSTTV